MLMAVEVDQVETFVAIVRRGGFTRAASSLHLSQPAISRRVHLLERELGRPLFDRTRGGARLTEAGQAFLPHAEALLASMRDGVEAVHGLDRTDRGVVTVALVGTLASTELTARLKGEVAVIGYQKYLEVRNLEAYRQEIQQEKFTPEDEKTLDELGI